MPCRDGSSWVVGFLDLGFTGLCGRMTSPPRVSTSLATFGRFVSLAWDLWTNVFVLFPLLGECPRGFLPLHGAAAVFVTGVPGTEERVGDDARDGGHGALQAPVWFPGIQHQEDGNDCVFHVEGQTLRMGHGGIMGHDHGRDAARFDRKVIG